MANISNKEIVAVLDKAGFWMTFEQLHDSMTAEYDCFTFHNRLNRLAEQGRIQHIPAQGMDRGLYGRIGLEKPG